MQHNLQNGETKISKKKRKKNSKEADLKAKPKSKPLQQSASATTTPLHSGVMVMGGIISGFRQSHLWIVLCLISHHRNLLMPASSKDLLWFC
jgi:hypothetical protein